MRPTPPSNRIALPSSLRSCCLAAAASLFFLPPSGFAGSDVKPADPKAATLEQLHPMYLGSLNTGMKGNDAYVDGNFSLVAPLWSSLGADGTLSGGMLFLEPYISWGEGGEVATSLGLGYRYLFGEQSISALTKPDGHQAGFFEEGISIGGSLFLDMLDTEANNQFWQLGVGLEVATRYVEVSGNYYIPLSDKELAEETRTTETFSTSTTTSRQSITPVNSPYAQGNTIAQDAVFTTTATTTTHTTTIERLFQRFEEGMEGWDAQIALLVPWVDRYMDVKVIGGYYSFDNQPFGPQAGGTGNVEGWKAGLEVRPVPALVFTGTWYEDERLTGGDWTVGVQMQIPFEAGDLGDGKGFWGRIKDSFKPRRRHLIERLAEPVHRQNAAVKVANSVKSEAKSSTKVQRRTRVVSSSKQQLVLADDVVFVNNGDAVNSIQAGSAAGTGSAEQPVDTIQAGSTLAQANSNTTGRVWSVYTQGTVAGYSGDVIAEDGSVNFIGSGSLLTGADGTAFGSGPAPMLVGGVLARGIGTFGITGYSVFGGLFGGTGDGIRAVNVNTVNILSNTVLNAGNESIVVRTENANITRAVIANNSTVGGAASGIRLRTEATSSLTATLTNNTVDLPGTHGIRAHSLGASTLNLAASNNTINSPAEEGVSLLTDDVSTLNVTLTDNTIDDVVCCGVAAISRDSSRLNLTASGNSINTPGSYGFNLESRGMSTLDATLNFNTIADSGYIGIGALSAGNSTFLLTATGNTILNPAFIGIALGSETNGNLTATLDGNTINGSGGHGIVAQSTDDSDITLTANNNTIDNPFGNGLYLTSDTTSSITVSAFVGNTINGAGGHGIAAESFGDSDIFMTGISHNTINNPGSHGLYLTSADTSYILVSLFENNTINGAGGHGIAVESFNSSELSLTAYDNTIDTPATNGLYAHSLNSSLLAVSLKGNTISGAGNHSYVGESENQSSMYHTFLNNQITGGTRGISVRSLNGSYMYLTAWENTITDTSGSGIFMGSVNNNSQLHASLNGNTILKAGGDGITAREFTGPSTLTVIGDTNNTVTGSGSGLSLDSVGNPTGTFILNGNSITLPQDVVNPP